MVVIAGSWPAEAKPADRLVIDCNPLETSAANENQARRIDRVGRRNIDAEWPVSDGKLRQVSVVADLMDDARQGEPDAPTAREA